MKGKVGVGYTLLSKQYYGLVLYPRHMINDYAMIRQRVSEYVYTPILDNVEGFAMRKYNWNKIFKQRFWKKNYEEKWCRRYVKSIQRVLDDHRATTAERFSSRIDYVELSAFGLDYKNKQIEIDGFNLDFMHRMLDEASGIGRLNKYLYKLCKTLDNYIYKIVGMAIKYDMHMEHVVGEPLIKFNE
jgi:hypothetical protein